MILFNFEVNIFVNLPFPSFCFYYVFSLPFKRTTSKKCFLSFLL